MTLFHRTTLFPIAILVYFASLSSSSSYSAHSSKRISSSPLQDASYSLNTARLEVGVNETRMTVDNQKGRRANTDMLSSENDLNFFDRLFNSRNATQNLSNRTVVPHIAPDGSVTSYMLCHLATFLGFESNSESNVASTNAIREIASALMALHDFNTGHSNIIPQISQCNDSSKLRFTMELIDTDYQPLTAAAELSEILHRTKPPTKDVESNVVQAYPAGIIGARRSSISSPLSILGSVQDLVTISHASTANEFSFKGEYPLFGRTVPSTDVDATALVSFLREVLHATHFGVLYVNDPFGLSYARSVTNAATEVNLTVNKISLPVGASRESVVRSLNVLKRTGYRYFLGVLFDEEFKKVMPLAYEMGLAGEEYFWMFTEVQMDLMNSPLIGGSDVARAVHGSAILATLAGKGLLEGTRFYDAYTSRFSTLWESEIGWNYLQSKLPQMDLTPDLIEGSEPTENELFMYEAVIAFCLASCHASKSTLFDFFTAYELYQSFTNITFDGLHGPTSFDHRTGDRSGDTVKYAVYNILGTESNLEVEAKYHRILREKEETLSAENSFNTKDMIWEVLPNKEFVYADGTTTPPSNLPPPQENKNLMPTAVAAIYLSICGLLLVLSIICLVWTYRGRNTTVVRASQPIFLYMLCVGTFLLTSSAIQFSMSAFDFDDKNIGAVCMGGTWLYYLGFVVSFSVLFTKTKRIYKIMAMSKQHKRIVIKPIHVMKPFFILLTFNITVLIIWTVVAPFEYRRYPIGTSVDRFGRNDSSIGICVPFNERSMVYTILSALLEFTNLLVVALSSFYAYRSRRISTEYSESKYIAISVYIALQAHLLRVLTVVMGSVFTSPTTFNYIFMLAIFMTSFGILAPLFGPKIVALRDEKKNELEKEKKKMERLERLRKFDALRKEQENNIAPVVTESNNDSDDYFSETPDDVDGGCGIKIVDFSQGEVCKKIQVELSKTITENLKLRSILSSKKNSKDFAMKKKDGLLSNVDH